MSRALLRWTPVVAMLVAACGEGDDNVAPATAASTPDASMGATAAADGSTAKGDAATPGLPPAASSIDIGAATLASVSETTCVRQVGNGSSICYAYLCCTDDAPCQWRQCSSAAPGHISIDVLATTSQPSGAVANTITSAPFHGLCFSEPGSAVPSWCETVTAAPGLVEGTAGGMFGVPTATDDVSVLVSVNKQIAGQPPYEWEPCYLTGTLAVSTGCTDMGGYCCFAPRSMGSVDPGNASAGIPAGDYYFGMHSFPDVSNDGPVPFATWSSTGVVTTTP